MKWFEQEKKMPQDFKVRPILNAGERHVDMRPDKLNECLSCWSPEEAVEASTEDAIVSEVGRPTLDDSGCETLEYFFCVEDEKGNRRAFRAVARAEIKVECEEIPMPPDPVGA